MKVLKVLLWFVISVLLFGCANVTEKPKDEAVKAPQSEIEKLITQLGDDDWQTRENAQAKLIEKGDSIIPELKKYENHSNPEIKSRVNYILKSVTFIKITERDVKIAQSKIMTIEQSLELYYADYSCYPKEEPGFSSRALVNALRGDLTSNPPKKAYYPFKKSEINSNGEWVTHSGTPYYYRNNNDANYSRNNPPPPDVHNIDTYDVWAQDGSTPKNTSPEEIARKTKICNWE